MTSFSSFEVVAMIALLLPLLAPPANAQGQIDLIESNTTGAGWYSYNCGTQAVGGTTTWTRELSVDPATDPLLLAGAQAAADAGTLKVVMERKHMFSLASNDVTFDFVDEAHARALNANGTLVRLRAEDPATGVQKSNPIASGTHSSAGQIGWIPETITLLAHPLGLRVDTLEIRYQSIRSHSCDCNPCSNFDHGSVFDSLDDSGAFKGVSLVW